MDSFYCIIYDMYDQPMNFNPVANIMNRTRESINKKSYLDYINLDQDSVLNCEFNKIVWTDTLFFKVETLFINWFDKKPSTIQCTIKNSNIEKIIDIICNSFSDFKIVTYTYKNIYELEENIVLCSKNHNIIVSISSFEDMETFDSDAEGSHSVSIFTNDLKFIKRMRDLISSQYSNEKDKSSVFIFERDSHGSMHLVPHKIAGFPVDIDSHYNDDFKDVDDRIKEWCSDSESINKKLVLLSGKPGTGKTNYLKNLISTQKNRRIIYIPPYQVGAIADPSFFSFISSYKNSLLIVEDAERVLVSRDTTLDNESVSLMLNLTDGILASALNFKVICTFNVEEDQIDKALTRKGRLFLKYRFDTLEPHKTVTLYKKLYNTDPPEKSMTLASIYENDDNGHVVKETRSIGFGV
jgi:hypothetical protein